MPRTAFVPTQEQRRVVKSAAAFGMPQAQIAAMIGLRAEKTLRKHFRSELDRGAGEAILQVANSLFKLATVRGNASAAMFFLKCRGGWRERPVFEQRNTTLPPFNVSLEQPPREPEKAPENPSEEPGQPPEKPPEELEL
jgi:hypothetical protein